MIKRTYILNKYNKYLTEEKLVPIDEDILKNLNIETQVDEELLWIIKNENGWIIFGANSLLVSEFPSSIQYAEIEKINITEKVLNKMYKNNENAKAWIEIKNLERIDISFLKASTLSQLVAIINKLKMK